ncbi:LysR family transcriptional regulator [Reinekea blandensis]|uniref:Probable transcriptional regulator n=1 Tax=Reinekea blandensis MED297 TaxID=314283 RepID=A4BDX8_9GAMM|nr:LysR family transcriptional regulator [Reinekea blandensis]EAR09737.1 probable transcriptional regulator [Reinekea blandensis MED297]
MRLLDSDLNLYRVFLTIYRTRNLTHAGEQLGVTQPAVSNALSRLRTIYDDPLFVRHGKWMRPTLKTEQIIPDVMQALQLLADTLAPETSDQPSE